MTHLQLSQDYLLETLMLGLRLAEGVDLTQFDRDIQQIILDCMQPYYKRQWLEIIDSCDRPIDLNYDPTKEISARMRLSDPEGFLFSNTVLATLFEKLA